MIACLCDSPVIDFLNSTGFRIGAGIVIVVGGGFAIWGFLYQRGYF